jgi:hypothetical protein
MNRSPLALSGLLLLVAGPAAAQEAPPIIGGVTTSSYEAVGAIIGYNERYGDLQSFCSGTLVDAEWVVTAAHCVTEGIEAYVRYGYDIYFVAGTEIYSETGWIDYKPVVYYAAHPDYSLPYNDAAVLQLGDGGMRSVTPIPLNSDRVDSSWVETDITYVGFGITSDSGSGSGTKRTVDVPIYEYYSGLIITWDSEGGANICSGDSGGAALRDDGGTMELVGINSFGFMISGSSRVLCDSPDAAAGITRVDAVLGWIEDEMGGISSGDSGGGSSGGGSSGGSSGGGSDATDDDDPEDDGEDDGEGNDDGSGSGSDGGVTLDEDDGEAANPEATTEPGKAVACASGATSGRLGLWGGLAALGLALGRRRR